MTEEIDFDLDTAPIAKRRSKRPKRDPDDVKESNKQKLTRDCAIMLRFLAEYDEPLETDEVAKGLGWARGRPGVVAAKFTLYFECDRSCTTRNKPMVTIHRHLFPYRHEYRKGGAKHVIG